MIVITNPSAIANEISILDSLFEEGLALLHIRKPDFSENEMAVFLHQIKLENRNKLVLHNYPVLAEDFGINRIHFSEKERKNNNLNTVNGIIFSTSTHSIEDFNSLPPEFGYAFLSPVYQSISKEDYYPETNLFEALNSKINHKTKVIALGGIDVKNIQKTLENGFDDVALLGAIWKNKNPIKQFKLCQQIVQSHFQ
ncbi:thiamine phosphate synthase [Flavobacterium sp. CFS9]|uniref:Thiamine phosphate synthase n=1 Tax=Flavobacterium sp. CFS9 TaxID=3143118 RepID=A0AAT9H226_9FLAO